MGKKIELFITLISILGFSISIFMKNEFTTVIFVVLFMVVRFLPGISKEINLGIKDGNLLATGVDAVAELLEISPRSGGNYASPGVTIKAKILYPDNTTGIVTIEDCISTVLMPKYIKGYVFNVKYNPNYKDRVCITKK